MGRLLRADSAQGTCGTGTSWSGGLLLQSRGKSLSAKWKGGLQSVMCCRRMNSVRYDAIVRV
eukprot:9910607-Alexandrium_andersonii.AAC.1